MLECGLALASRRRLEWMNRAAFVLAIAGVLILGVAELRSYS